MQGKDALYQEEKDKLLLLMEQGNLAHAQGKWEESAQFFRQALDLHEKLFTVSVSAKVTSTLISDQSDIYYGEAYEISSIHLLQTLNHLMKWREATDRDDLFRARAQVVAWNKYLETRAQETEIEPVFKDDLMAKMLGAQVHELIGSNSDLQIALDLYVRARDILLRNYGAYASFNSKSKTFVKDYEKFPKMKLENVFKNYIDPTPAQEKLRDEIEARIILLAQQVRSARVSNYLKTFGKKAADFPARESANVRVIVSLGQAPLKTAAAQYIGLTSALNDPNASASAKILAGVSAVALTMFAADKLGLMPPPNSWNPVGAQLGLEMSFAVATGASIRFQLPVVQAAPIEQKRELIVSDMDGNEVARHGLPLVQPVGEIAQQAVAEKAVARYWRVGLRLALKHAAAIAASFATYKALKGNNSENDFLARNAAVFQYLAAAKGIEASERADTRGWATLPESFNLTQFKLAPGKYKISVVAEQKTTDLGTWEISTAPTIYYARL